MLWLLFQPVLVLAQLRIQGDLYNCQEESRCQTGCEKPPNFCNEMGWTFGFTNEPFYRCSVCYEGYFGADCRSYSPKCKVVIRNSLNAVPDHAQQYCERKCFQGMRVLFFRADDICNVYCVNTICKDMYHQRTCLAGCEACEKSPVVGCMDGLCFFNSEERPPRVCAYGYGTRKVTQQDGATVVQCERCIDSELHCGQKGLTCREDDYSKCSCDPHDYGGHLRLREGCRSCSADRWGPVCENTCYCSDEAECDINTGECKCRADKPNCRICLQGQSGDKCDQGCSARCHDHQGVLCKDDMCYKTVEDPSNSIRACPLGYGSAMTKDVPGANGAQGYVCERCFESLSVVPRCGAEGQTTCLEANSSACSCWARDYPHGKVPEGCRMCDDDKWGDTCQNICQCGDGADCNYLTGICSCPLDKNGVPIDCRRCPYGMFGERCELICNATCNNHKLVHCEENRCISALPSIRACAYGFGGEGGRKLVTSSRGTVCNLCFSQSRELCGSEEVMCSAFNSSRCSCERMDYEVEVPINCRRCPDRTYGMYCHRKCRTGRNAYCDPDNGAVYCFASNDPEKRCTHCEFGYGLRNETVGNETIPRCLKMKVRDLDIPLFVEWVTYPEYLIPCIVIPAGLFVCAIVGFIGAVVQDFPRIKLIYKQYFKARVLSMERMFLDPTEEEGEEKTASTQQLKDVGASTSVKPPQQQNSKKKSSANETTSISKKLDSEKKEKKAPVKPPATPNTPTPQAKK